MKYLVIILIFASCSTYKAYQKVAADPFVDQRESVLLSQKCLSQYPIKVDTTKLSSTIDSSDYNSMVKAYNDMIDSIIAFQEDTAIGVEGDIAVVSYRPIDSLRVIRNFLKKYHPPTIKETVVKEVHVNDGRAVSQLETQLRVCAAEQAKLTAEKDNAVAKSRKRGNALGWVIAGGLVLGAIGYGVGKLKV